MLRLWFVNVKYVQNSEFDVKMNMFSHNTRTKRWFVREPPSSPKGGDLPETFWRIPRLGCSHQNRKMEARWKSVFWGLGLELGPPDDEFLRFNSFLAINREENIEFHAEINIFTVKHVQNNAPRLDFTPPDAPGLDFNPPEAPGLDLKAPEAPASFLSVRNCDQICDRTCDQTCWKHSLRWDPPTQAIHKHPSNYWMGSTLVYIYIYIYIGR